MFNKNGISLISVALKNLKYRRLRSFSMVFFIFLLSSSFFVGGIIGKSMEKDVDNAVMRMGASAIIAPAEYDLKLRDAMFYGSPCTMYFSDEWLEKIKPIEGIEKISPQLYLSTIPGSSCCDTTSQLIAFDEKTDFIISPWLKDQNINLKDGQVILGSNLLMEPGETIKFFNIEFEVAGNLEKTKLNYDNSVFMNFNTAKMLLASPEAKEYLELESLDGLISMIMVKAENDYPADKIKRNIDLAFRKEGISVTTPDTLIKASAQYISRFSGYSIIFSSILFTLSVLAFFTVFTITMNERLVEFGILSAIGTNSAQMIKITLYEALFLSMAGALSGIIIPSGIMILFKSLIASKFYLSNLFLFSKDTVLLAFICICACVFSAVLASLYSIVKITKSEPYMLTRENG